MSKTRVHTKFLAWIAHLIGCPICKSSLPLCNKCIKLNKDYCTERDKEYAS